RANLFADTVLRNNCVSGLNFIQVTCYAALRYLADFKAGWSFGEGQVSSESHLDTSPQARSFWSLIGSVTRRVCAGRGPGLVVRPPRFYYLEHDQSTDDPLESGPSHARPGGRRRSMIHLALEVLAFLFLAWVGLIALGVSISILGAIGKALNRLFAAT